MSAFNRSSRPLINQLANQHSTSQPIIYQNCDINLANWQQFHQPFNRPSISQEAWNPNLFSQPIRMESDIQPTIQPIKTESANQPYHPTNQNRISQSTVLYPTNQNRVRPINRINQPIRTESTNQPYHPTNQYTESANQSYHPTNQNRISQLTVPPNQSEQNQPVNRTIQPISILNQPINRITQPIRTESAI